ncbi:MAG: EAL domain-containing protein, partial [Gallionella sp.]
MPLSYARLRANAIALLNRLRRMLAGIELREISQAIAMRYAHKGPGSLANRILLLQFVWAFFIYVLVIAALWFATILVIESSVRHQGEAWIAKLDELGIPIYATDDPARLKSAISYLRNFPEIELAQYMDDSGTEVIAEYRRKGSAIKSIAPLNDGSIKQLGRTDVERKTFLFDKIGGSQMRISAPIWVKSISNDGMIDYSLDKKSGEKVETIGFIDIVMDYSKITADLNRNLIYASMLIAVMMFVATLVARIMVRWALMPLSELEEPLTRLANGETDVNVNSSGDKEIARIGIALNTTISALKERDEALRQLANHDALTGLFNRNYFVQRLEHEVGRVARGGGGGALFFFDLDRFKYINDTYGHAAGDRLLVEIANLLKQRIRENDLVARFGGDEFTLLAYNAGPKDVQEIAEAFIALMQAFTFYEAGDMQKINFSIGITFIDDGSRTAHEYLKEADAAVHQAKARGRNGFSIFARDTQSSSAETGIGWHDRLQEALQKNQAILYYQPLLGLKNQREYIHEVLLRLPDIGQKVITPAAFMSAAERFGLMSEFDSQVIKKAALVLADLKNPQAVLSLNLSEQFFAKHNIPEFLEEIVSAHHIAPKQIIFELSERYIVRNLEKLRSMLAVLTQRGYRFAIDDFGSGFGSFNYIKDFPVHFLKIDGASIEHIIVDGIAKVTVRAIVEVAAELNMQTIAKCVTDEASVTLLRELGVDFAQGNHIAIPSPQISGPIRATKRPNNKK